MKNKILLMASIVLATVFSCTDDFNEINEQPDALTSSDVSAKYFVTTLQQKLYRSTTVPLWYGDLLHPDQFCGQWAMGHSSYAWNGDFGWDYFSIISRVPVPRS